MVERRLIWLAGIVVLWGAAIFFKLVSLQVLHHRQYAAMARARQELVIEIPAPRGSIFDRAGAPLAMSVPTESVHINPLKVPDLRVASEILALVLHMDRTELYGRMQNALDNHRGYLVVKKKIPFEEAKSLRNMRLDWIDIDEESQRHYPNGPLAAHILGGVDFEERGNGGIEMALDEVLRGIPGRERLLTDVKRRGVDSLLSNEPKPGTSLTLTIDERLQFVAERELAAQVAAKNARSGSVVVMDPHNGDILALASYPTYDPNVPPHEGEDPLARANHAIAVPFEPGSVFKVMTLSAALETTRLTPASMIDCGRGSITLFGRTIHEAHGGYGIISLADVLKHSSNVGAIKIGMQVGQDHMYDYVRRFGFGQRTGVPLPGETRGRLRPLKVWGKTSLASISMGQEVSVTTLQLAQAACVIANGGLLVRPRLVMRRGSETIASAPPVRVINPETAITMRQMMEGVVLPGGTGFPEARLEGYSVGGKTGSAQIFDFITKHYTHNYNGSFMGFAPLNNPAIVVVVTLNGTHGSGGYGGRAAAPVFHTVAQEALRVFDVPKDLPDAPPATAIAANTAAENDDVAFADLSDGPNILEDPDEDAALPQSKPAAAAVSASMVPDFRGKSMRAVLAEAAAKGLTVLPAGSGVARVQFPPAGSALHQGERIRVRFAR
ncbi:MAG TPA: penicillin-binding protein [Bryobacteraceae bacterium]|nr:penicillin-binding protein [Bryobacteraceae bacterium]